MAGYAKAVVAANQETIKGSGINYLRLRVPYVNVSAVRPGMFAVFKPKSAYYSMPRPFSIALAWEDGMDFYIKNVGPNTAWYTSRKQDDIIEISDPRGKPIVVDSRFRHIILVAGGYGAAALTMLAYEQQRQGRRVTALLGGRDYTQIVGEEMFRRFCDNTRIITKFGDGKTGLVTDMLKEEFVGVSKGAIVIACGPNQMLKAVWELCKSVNVKCLVGLEEIMACGMGACKGCAVFDADGNPRHVCEDGPFFPAELIDWDKLIPPEIKVIKKQPLAPEPLKTTLRGQNHSITLDYPILAASGCSDENSFINEYLSLKGLGAIVVKGISVLPSAGNPAPRVCEVPAGMLNAIGLENVGLKVFLNEKLPIFLSLGKPIIVNIYGKDKEEFKILAKALNKEEITGIEVNVSCPNVELGGVAFGTDPDATYRKTNTVRQAAPDKFLIVKLTPNVADIVDIAMAAVKGGADALSLINTVAGMAIDVRTGKPKLGNITGGQSGPAIKPRGVYLVYQTHKALPDIPIIGTGGIRNGDDAAEYIMAGASAVSAGTAGFSNDQIFPDMANGLLYWLKYHGHADIGEMVGMVK